jgi:hypothetical protein
VLLTGHVNDWHETEQSRFASARRETSSRCSGLVASMSSRVYGRSDCYLLAVANHKDRSSFLFRGMKNDVPFAHVAQRMIGPSMSECDQASRSSLRNLEIEHWSSLTTPLGRPRQNSASGGSVCHGTILLYGIFWSWFILQNYMLLSLYGGHVGMIEVTRLLAGSASDSCK